MKVFYGGKKITLFNDGKHMSFKDYPRDLFLVTTYKFDKSIYDNLIPEFNSGYPTNYKIVDTVQGNIVTRSLHGETFPTMIRFGSNSDDATDSALSLKEVVYLNTSNLTSCSSMFNHCQNVTRIDTTDWDTSKVTDMRFMFRFCINLTELNINNFDTRNVKNMYCMFQHCESFTTINVSNFNTDQVTDIAGMFDSCKSLTSINGMNNWNTSQVINMSYLFGACKSLNSLDVSNFITSNVLDMDYMFRGCKSLEQVDVSKWNTGNVKSMRYLFGVCSSLTSLDLSNWNVNKVLDMIGMFSDDSSSEEIHLESLNISNWNLNSSVNCNHLFLSANNLKTITMKNSNATSVNKIVDALQTRASNDKGTLDITGLNNISQVKVETAESKYWTIKNVRLITVYKFNKATYANLVPEFDSDFSVDYRISDSVSGDIVTRTIYNYGYPTKMQFGQTWVEGESGATAKSQSLISIEKALMANITTCADMFRQCRNLTTVKTTGWNTAKVTNMTGMFADCYSLASLDVSSFNTSKVTNMSGMFWNSKVLTSLNLSNFDTKAVISMANMFNGCNALTSLNINNWNTSSVADMNSMFCNCTSLATLSVGVLNTSSVKNMGAMFYNCDSFTSLDLSAWNTNNDINMYQMFYGCNNLTSLNLSNWNVHDNNNLDEIFKDTSLSSVTMNNSNNSSIHRIVKELPNRDTTAAGAFTTNITDLLAESWQDATYKNWAINTDFLAARYKFNRTTHSNAIPAFDSSVSGYSIRDDLPGETDDTNVLDDNYKAYLYKINDGLCFFIHNKATGINTLIDCAEENKAVSAGVLTHMKNVLGVTRIDHLIITHFHSDHVGGFRDFAAQFEIGKVYYKALKTNLLPQIEIDWKTGILYDEALQICRDRNIPTKVITENYDIPEAGLKIIAGDMSDNYNNYNRQSLGITVTMNNKKIFVAGDLIHDTELMILDYLEECDALIIGHHGYANSNHPEMLNIINAKHYFVPTYGTDQEDHRVINELIATYTVNYFSTHNNGDRITMYFDDKGFFHDAINRVNGTVVGDADAIEDTVVRSVYTKTHPKKVGFHTNDTDKMNVSIKEVYFVDTNELTTTDNMFKGCTSMIRLSCADWKMSKVTSMMNMFDCCTAIRSLNVSNWDVSNVVDMRSLFYYLTNVRELDLSKWNTRNCINMQWMFSRAWYLDEIKGIEDLDVSNVTDMNSMFYYCGVYNLDLSKWKTGKVTNMSYMFSDCWRMVTLNVTGWDTSKVTNMNTMFGYYEYGSPQLTTVTGMQTWDVSKVTNMYQLFWECTALQSIDISGWNLAACTNFSWSFCDCTSLTSLKADGMIIPSGCNNNSMFEKYRKTGCPLLKTVSIKNSDATTVNKIINVLPTRTSSDKGSLTITGISGSASTSTATNKYWTVTN